MALRYLGMLALLTILAGCGQSSSPTLGDGSRSVFRARGHEPPTAWKALVSGKLEIQWQPMRDVDPNIVADGPPLGEIYLRNVGGELLTFNVHVPWEPATFPIVKGGSIPQADNYYVENLAPGTTVKLKQGFVPKCVGYARVDHVVATPVSGPPLQSLD